MMILDENEEEDMMTMLITIMKKNHGRNEIKEEKARQNSTIIVTNKIGVSDCNHVT